MNEHRLQTPRSARYYTIGDETSPRACLVLHGYGERAADFVSHFERFHDFYVIAPEGLSRFYLEGHRGIGASWMTRDDREAEIGDYRRYLDAVHTKARLEDRKVTILGYSQGAHTACRWVAGGKSIHRLILWGSGLPDDLDAASFQEAVHDRGLTLVAGTRDRIFTDEMVERDVARAASMGLAANVVRYDGGHAIEPATLQLVMRDD